MCMGTVMVKGDQIYSAGLAGAKLGYNRTYSDSMAYEKILENCYTYHLNDIDNHNGRRKVISATGGDWRNAYLPVELMIKHKFKGGQPCEPHARVKIVGEGAIFIDIPMEYWDFFDQFCKHV